MQVELLISEQGTLTSLNDVVDGNVVEYDSGVRTSKFGRELSGDEFAVANEFPRAVREGEFNSLSCKLPCGRPLSGCGNMLFRISHSKANFHIGKVSLSLFINHSMVERGEKMVEIEDLSLEDSVPLRVGNSGGSTSGHTDDGSSSRDVPGVDFDLFASLEEAGVVGIRRDGIDPTGW